MKRSGFKPRTKPMARTGITRKPQKPKRPKRKNSRPNEDKPVREQYRRDHRSCLLCGRTAEHIHHIRRGVHRADIPANLAALCGHCHGLVHDASSVYAAYQIEILYRKSLIGEFDPAALDALGGERIAGWLERHKPGAVSASLVHYWFRLVRMCEGE